jgi:phospholipase/carboxylesterase/glyoxalase family protein
VKAEFSYAHRFVRGTGSTTLLLLHGTGGDENDMIPLGHGISPESSVLSPRGKMLENGMPRFFRRIRGGVLDVEDLKFRSKELSEFVKEASLRYGFRLDSVVPVGYSNGANIAASILLLRFLPLPGAILFRPMTPFVPERAPDLKGTAVFVAAGSADPLVHGEETTKLVGLLERGGAKVEVNWENAGHGLTPDEVSKARDWFGRQDWPK